MACCVELQCKHPSLETSISKRIDCTSPPPENMKTTIKTKNKLPKSAQDGRGLIPPLGCPPCSCMVPSCWRPHPPAVSETVLTLCSLSGHMHGAKEFRAIVICWAQILIHQFTTNFCGSQRDRKPPFQPHPWLGVQPLRVHFL